jgi:hypothetical protein
MTFAVQLWLKKMDVFDGIATKLDVREFGPRMSRLK